MVRPGTGGGAEQAPAHRPAVEQQLRSAVGTVLAHPRHGGLSVLLEGPPGIGKSFLCRTVAADAAATGATVCTARGSPGSARDGFAVVRQFAGPSPPDTDPAEEAFALVDGWCAAGPVLCWVDDAHQADAASLAVLRRLVWAARDLPLVVLVSARGYPVREPLELLADQVTHRLRLPPMPAPAVAALVRERIGRDPGPALRAQLATAAGNPLLVTEMLTALDTRGRLDRTAPGEVELIGDVEPVDGLDAAVREHLAGLDGPLVEILTALAVLGGPAAEQDVAELLYASVSALRPAVERGMRAGLLARPAPGRLDVAHDAYRDAAYAALDPPRRAAAHRRAAEVLRARAAAPGEVAEQLVAAARQGPDPGAAAALRTAAAHSAEFAPAVAAELLGDLDAFVSDAERDRIAVERADALFVSGQHRRAEELAHAHLATTADPQVAAELHAVLVRSQLNRGDAAAAMRTIDGLLAAAGLPPPVRHRLESLRCWTLVLAGRHREGARLGRTLLAELVAAGDQDTQAGLLATLACAEFLDARADRATALMHRQEALRLTDEGVQARVSTLIWPPLFELYGRDLAAARSAATASRRATHALGSRWVDPYRHFIAGELDLWAGEWDDAAAELATGLEQAEESGSGWISSAVATLAYIDAHRGRVRWAAQRLQALADRLPTLQFGMDEPGLARLAVLEVTGALDEAVPRAAALWSAAPDAGPTWMLRLAPDLARIAVTGDDPALCRRMATDLEALNTDGCPLLAPAGELAAGMAARGLDRIDRIDAAADAARARGNALLAAFADEEAACAAAAAGRLGPARDRMERAAGAYEAMGAASDRDRLLGRTRTLGLRRGPRERHRAVSFGPASLTATERRVAALIRDGLTNPQIAARLWLSPRTVQTHVSHILTKLGVRSRADIAADTAADTSDADADAAGITDTAGAHADRWL
ncbi:MAG: LuxR C-terminal-related transcriptional regulator [Pseudonocardia sp.]